MVVMDFALPSMNGAVATRHILRIAPANRRADSQHACRAELCPHVSRSGRARLPAEERDGSGTGRRRCKQVAAGEQVLDPRLGHRADPAEPRPALSTRELEVLQLIVHGKSNKEIAAGTRSERQHRGRASREHHAGARHSQHGRTRRLCDSHRAGEYRMNRRTFLLGGVPLIGAAAGSGSGFSFRPM